MNKLNYNGIEFNVSDTGFSNWWFTQCGPTCFSAEPLVVEKIFAYRNPKRMFISAGGGFGVPLEMWASKMYEKVFALEPDPSGFSEFKKNMEANNTTNVQIDNVALFNDSVKILTLHLDHNKYYGGSGIFHDNNKAGSVEVPCVSLRKYFTDNNITKNAFLNLDLEGAEYAVFDDTEFFEIYRPFIMIEIHWQYMTPSHIENFNSSLNKIKHIYPTIDTSLYTHKSQTFARHDFFEPISFQ